jgi:fatty acid desaturase
VAERNIDRETERDVRRRGPDLLTLLAGIATLLVSSYVLTDGAIWVPSLDPRWLLAGGALLVGVFMLVASVRGRKR